MKIAVSTTKPGLDAQVDPRFGRCQYFIIVDPNTMEFEDVDNAGALASGGAGVATAQMIASSSPSPGVTDIAQFALASSINRCTNAQSVPIQCDSVLSPEFPTTHRVTAPSSPGGCSSEMPLILAKYSSSALGDRGHC